MIIECKDGTHWELQPDQRVNIYPRGGGPNYCVRLEELLQDFDKVFDGRQAAYQTEVSCEGLDEGVSVPAWLFKNDRWNGWVKPYVEFDSVTKLVLGAVYDPVTDTFTLEGDPECGRESLVIERVSILTEKGGKMLYNLADLGFCFWET